MYKPLYFVVRSRRKRGRRIILDGSRKWHSCFIVGLKRRCALSKRELTVPDLGEF